MVDPQLAPNSLRGARIMLACEAYDLVLKRICQDQLVSAIVARGATPVIAPAPSIRRLKGRLATSRTSAPRAAPVRKRC